MKPYEAANSEETDPEDEAVALYRVQLRKRRRVIWRIGVGAALIFLAVLALVTYSDAPPPDVSDLTRREPWPAPDPEGDHARMAKLADSLPEDGIVPAYEPQDMPADSPDWMPDGWRARETYADFRDFLAAGRGWTPSRLALWDAGLAQLAADCAELMGIEAGPAPQGAGEASWKIAEVGAQLAVASGMYLNSGYKREAVDILMLTCRIGDRMRNSSVSVYGYSRAVALQSMAIRNLTRLVIADEEAAQLVATEWRMQKAPDDSGVFATAIRMEYPRFAAEVDMLSAEGASEMGHPELFRWLAKTRVLYPLVMKPNVTKGLYADYLRQQMAWRDLPRTEYEAKGGHRLLDMEFRDVFRPVNLYGRLLAWQASNPATAYSRRIEHRSAMSAFEAVLGLRLYHADHGALPETLDALVPRYLPAVPVDYHDGATIRYSRATAEVWSAGRDSQRHSLDFAKPSTPAPAPAP